MEAEVVKPVSYETVPPAEVVANQEQRPVCGICPAINLNALKMPFQAIPRVEAEEADKEANMPCPYYHLEPLILTSDLSGLR